MAYGVLEAAARIHEVELAQVGNHVFYPHVERLAVQLTQIAIERFGRAHVATAGETNHDALFFELRAQREAGLAQGRQPNPRLHWKLALSGPERGMFKALQTN
jgi:hypothetical protein